MVRGAEKRVGLRLTRRLAPLVLLVVTLAGCTTGTDPRPGESPSAPSSVENTSFLIAPGTFLTTDGSTVATTADPPTASSTPDGVATSASAPERNPKAILSTTWLLVRAVAAGATFNSPQPPGSSQYSSYTVQFVADQLIANDGCNTIQIAATLDAHTVTTSGDPTSTASACRKTALRDAYDRELFKAPLDWRVSGKRLTLTTSSGDTFDFEPCRRPDTKGGAEDYACLGPSH